VRHVVADHGRRDPAIILILQQLRGLLLHPLQIHPCPTQSAQAPPPDQSIPRRLPALPAWLIRSRALGGGAMQVRACPAVVPAARSRGALGAGATGRSSPDSTRSANRIDFKKMSTLISKVDGPLLKIRSSLQTSTDFRHRTGGRSPTPRRRHARLTPGVKPIEVRFAAGSWEIWPGAPFPLSWQPNCAFIFRSTARSYLGREGGANGWCAVCLSRWTQHTARSSRRRAGVWLSRPGIVRYFIA